MSFLAMDPPRPHPHALARVQGLHPPAGGRDGGRVRRHRAVEHIDAAARARQFDFVADFAGRMPMDVISEMIGVPHADRAELRRLADLLVRPGRGSQRHPARGDRGRSHHGRVLRRHGHATAADRPADDLTSALLDADLDGRPARPTTRSSAFLFLMTVAGNETTTKLLANAWYWGWRFPDERAKVLADPARVPDWVEETLRFDTSTADAAAGDHRRRGAPRHHRCPTAHASCSCVGSANRDEPRLRATPIATTSTATPRSSSASAAAATSAWAPPWLGSRPASGWRSS